MYSRSVSGSAFVLEPAYANLAERVRGAFRASPALSLTVWQTADWLGLDEILTSRVLHALAIEEFLECGDDGKYRLLLKH